MRRWVGVVLASVTWLAAQVSYAETPRESTPPPTDQWHHVTPASPFFSPEIGALRVAAVLQSDGLFARLVLGAEGQGAYVTVALPGDAPAEMLRSELVFGDGARMGRDITPPALDTLAMPGPGLIIYSFAVAAEDLSAFRRASEWVLTAQGQDPVAITLAGSSSAIRDALEAPMPQPEVAQGETGYPAFTTMPAAAQ